ncbi:type II toxin-antitoxin system TacA family antitoxin [Emticicia fluvialis]|uniref:type II toxin-antitoxin system TacA family antitoxin n=1 Tax=Emticicia fluvialis TaxID=2974474 RepID=UPI00216579AE|nr:DUF1778 domain-containing protein [Emticicia fluvialis]
MGTSVNDRLDVRISKEQKELIKYASELSGFKSLTEFVIFCINKEAVKIIDENNHVLKSIEDKKVFLETLMNHPSPNNNLQKARMNYEKFAELNGAENTDTRKTVRQK